MQRLVVRGRRNATPLDGFVWNSDPRFCFRLRYELDIDQLGRKLITSVMISFSHASLLTTSKYDVPHKAACQRTSDMFILPYTQAARFNESLVAALDAVAAVREDVYRRASDGVVTASFLKMRAVPVADDYPLRLKIFLEVKALDKRTNAELFAGAGVAGLGKGAV